MSVLANIVELASWNPWILLLASAVLFAAAFIPVFIVDRTIGPEGTAQLIVSVTVGIWMTACAAAVVVTAWLGLQQLVTIAKAQSIGMWPFTGALGVGVFLLAACIILTILSSYIGTLLERLLASMYYVAGVLVILGAMGVTIYLH